MRRLGLLVPFVLAAIWSTQANASKYAWCEMNAGDGSGNYVSGIAEIQEDPDALLAFRSGPFAKGFRSYVHAELDPDASHVDCHSRNSLREAKEFIKLKISANKDRKYRLTNWLGGRPAAVDGGEQVTRPHQGISIVAPGSKPKPETMPVNSRAANEQRASDDADFARKMAEYEQQLAEQKAAVAEFERKRAEYEAKMAEAAAKAKASQAEWERRVAACKAGDRSQCSSRGSHQ